MKGFFFLFFGLVLGAVSASGQGPAKADEKLPQWKLHLPAPSGLKLDGFLPLPDTTWAGVTMSEGPIRRLMPDHMPCLVTDLARVEQMPMLRSTNKDPMPSGFHSGRPRSFYVTPGDPIYVIPGGK